MNTPPLHLCIATGQNLANLIPALQCRAREVWILQTPAMKASAGHLAAALKARHIAVQRIDFADDDVTTLHAQAAAIAERLDGRALAINLSGGTKLMTLALVQTLAEHLKTAPTGEPPHLVYTDTNHRRLDWLGPAARAEAMASVLKVDDILLAQGYRRQAGSGGAEAAEWQRAADGRKALTRYMGDQAHALGPFFGVLNAMAQDALDAAGRLVRPLQRLQYAPGNRYARLLRMAREEGLVAWDGDTEIGFADAGAATYLGGGWMEEYAGVKISGARPDGGWAPRARIEHVDSRARNEIDALAVHGNRLLLVECKAARPGSAGVADWIYKASQLARQVGGSMARALIVSARSPSPEHLQRAHEYGVDVLHGQQIADLPDYLRRWMAGA